MENKKIIIFPGNFLPHTGGLETHVDEFVKHLSKKNYDITIFTPNSGGKTKEIIHNNVKVIRYPSIEVVSNFTFPNLFSARFWSLLKQIYKNDYDIVMTRTRFFPNSLLGAKFAKLRLHPIKLVHVEHGSSFVNDSKSSVTIISRIWDETLGRLILALSDEVVVISNAVKKFTKKLTNKKLILIPRGIDIDPKLKPLNNPRLKNKIVFCTVSRFYSWKGIDNAINAYESLSEELKNKSVYFIAGYGPEEKRLKKLSKNIIFLGKVSHDKAIQLFKASDVYIHSSHPGGGLSSSLMQSMACGCTSVASPHEGAKDIITKNNGFLLKNNSVKELNEGMKKALTTNIKQKQNNAKKLITQEYSWKKAIKKYEELFDSILS